MYRVECTVEHTGYLWFEMIFRPSKAQKTNYIYLFRVIATWSYVIYSTVQVSFQWNSNNTVTDVKIAKFDQSNSPCLAFTFFDVIKDRFLEKCPSDWEILENGKLLQNE